MFVSEPTVAAGFSGFARVEWAHFIAVDLTVFVCPTSWACNEAHSSLFSEIILTVFTHVLVDLSRPVSVRDLQQFLECVPEDADLDGDVRWSEAGKSATRYLGLNIPLARKNGTE